ncbi:MAG TPA: C4-dicarboxylate ABC transporter, partial [Acidobacteria bacterium]|nr:C4-dicarboxylate ABC transporter [Acidobacteriota bacterium]
MPKRREVLGTLAASAVAAATPLRFARSAEVTLKLHHFLPPVSNAHRNLIEPWARAVREASEGRIEVEIFPAMQLGGKPPSL